MDGLRFPVAIHLHGTLAADAQGAFALPIGMTFESVCACASNDSDAKLQLGLADDDDALMTAKAIGDSSVPKTFVKTDFNGVKADAKNPPHLDKGAVVTWKVDFDGAGGTAAKDVSILFSFLEG